HPDADLGRVEYEAELDRRIGRRVLAAVRDDVRERLAELVGVDERLCAADVPGWLRYARVPSDAKGLDEALDGRRQRLAEHREVSARPGLNASEVEQLRYDSGDLVALAPHGRENLAALCGRRVGVLQELRVSRDHGNRRAKLVRRSRDEPALGTVYFVGPRDVAEIGHAGRGRRTDHAALDHLRPRTLQSEPRSDVRRRFRAIAQLAELRPECIAWQPDELRTRPAGQLEERGVGLGHAAAGAEGHEAVRRQRKDLRQLLVALRESRLCLGTRAVGVAEQPPEALQLADRVTKFAHVERRQGLLVFPDRDAVRHALDLRERLRDRAADDAGTAVQE